MNKKILASIFVIGMLALAMGYGTYSYFSSTKTSTGNTFTAGTLDIKLNGADEAVAVWTSGNFAPGETVTATLHIVNVGTTGAYWFYFGISSLTNPDGLAGQIHVTEFYVDALQYPSEPGLHNDYNHVDWMATSGPSGWGTTAPLTLAEFGSYAGTATPYGFMAQIGTWSGTYDPTAPKILVPYGGEVDVKMTLLFNPDAGNEFQGKSCSFDVTVKAWNGPPSAYYPMSPSGYGY